MYFDFRIFYLFMFMHKHIELPASHTISYEVIEATSIKLFYVYLFIFNYSFIFLFISLIDIFDV